MISNEQEKRAAVKAVKALNQVLSTQLVGSNSLHKHRVEAVRNDIQKELGAYLARKELEKWGGIKTKVHITEGLVRKIIEENGFAEGKDAGFEDAITDGIEDYFDAVGVHSVDEEKITKLIEICCDMFYNGYGYGYYDGGF